MWFDRRRRPRLLVYLVVTSFDRAVPSGYRMTQRSQIFRNPSPSSAPFAAWRDYFVLGEAAQDLSGLVD